MRLRKSLWILLFPWFIFPAANAQWVNLTATNLHNPVRGTLNGYLCVQPVNSSNRPLMNAAAGNNGGAISTEEECASVSGGVLASGFQVPDTSISSPVNMCLRVTLKNSNGVAFYTNPCYQPTSAPGNSVGCVTTGGITTCNYDAYTPPSTPLVPATVGPTGPPANLSISSVTTLAPGSPATVALGGSAPNYSLSYGIPAGSGGVAANAAGGANQVQYYCGSASFCADSLFTYSSTTHTLSLNATSIGTRYTVSASSESALVSAIAAACNGTAHGYLALDPGQSLSITAPIATVPSNCTINWGGATLTLANAADSNVITLSNVSGVHFEGSLYINGNGSAQTNPTAYTQLITLTNVNDSDFDRIYLSNAEDTCLDLVGSSRNKFEMVEANNCGVSGIGNPTVQGTGVFVNQGSADNEFGDIYTDTSSGQGNIVILGTTASPSPRNKIDRFTAKNAAQKGVIVLGDAPYTTIRGGYISGNGANTNGAGIYISGSDGTPDYINVGNITGYNCGNNCFEESGNLGSYGNQVCNGTVYVTGGGYCFYFGGSNNTFGMLGAYNAAADGIEDYGSDNAITTAIALNNGSHAANTYAGFRVSGGFSLGYGNSVSNLISGNGGTTNQAYGIVEQAGAYGNTYATVNFPSNTMAPTSGVSSTSQVGTQSLNLGYSSSTTVPCPAPNVPLLYVGSTTTSAITLTIPTTCPGLVRYSVQAFSSGGVTVATSGSANGIIVNPGMGGAPVFCAGGFCQPDGPLPPRAKGVVQLSSGTYTLNTTAACLPASSGTCVILYSECQADGTSGWLTMSPLAGVSLTWTSSSNTDDGFICYEIKQ